MMPPNMPMPTPEKMKEMEALKMKQYNEMKGIAEFIANKIKQKQAICFDRQIDYFRGTLLHNHIYV